MITGTCRYIKRTKKLKYGKSLTLKMLKKPYRCYSQKREMAESF
jgi:hypothetical protein